MNKIPIHREQGERMAQAKRELGLSMEKISTLTGKNIVALRKYFLGVTKPDAIVFVFTERGYSRQWIMDGSEPKYSATTAETTPNNLLFNPSFKQANATPNGQNGSGQNGHAHFSAEIRSFRSLVLDDESQDMFIPKFHAAVKAGTPEIAVNDSFERRNLSKLYKDCFIVEVSGDSMVNAGIEDGDEIIVRQTPSYKSGDIIIARINGELTLKGVQNGNGVTLLSPANPAYKPIRIDENTEFECVGVLIQIQKQPRKYLMEDTSH